MTCKHRLYMIILVGGIVLYLSSLIPRRAVRLYYDERRKPTD